jgi:hypothetical protein
MSTVFILKRKSNKARTLHRSHVLLRTTSEWMEVVLYVPRFVLHRNDFRDTSNYTAVQKEATTDFRINAGRIGSYRQQTRQPTASTNIVPVYRSMATVKRVYALQAGQLMFPYTV